MSDSNTVYVLTVRNFTGETNSIYLIGTFTKLGRADRAMRADADRTLKEMGLAEVADIDSYVNDELGIANLDVYLPGGESDKKELALSYTVDVSELDEPNDGDSQVCLALVAE
jgi:hypothetical protein